MARPGAGAYPASPAPGRSCYGARGQSGLLKTGVYFRKAGFNGRRAAIEQFSTDYFRSILKLGIDFPAPFVGRWFFQVEIDAAVFHLSHSSFA
jgi:hypothetical protein